ncbi:DUF4239 domain-containing protein [Phreatobacter stygius]|uniref:DUF4239 domain-containing protein n=2 Tax=Phreatobacter stygius TaxID=1940610 RepID=A0A4D7BFM9_9HYPH|nr:DUF4239 domain-containing protein [Phreatobacter stygius]
MNYLIAAGVFVALTGASLLCLAFHERLPSEQRDERTHDVVKLAINIFVVMTSLVLGLLITSVKRNFDSIDTNVHSFATEMILFDRALRFYGPEAAGARQLLGSYVERALRGTWPAQGEPLIEDKDAERVLDELEQRLRAINPADTRHVELWNDALQRLQRIVALRWTLIGEAGGTVSSSLLIMLVAWLTLIFASLGYNAPRNQVVVATLLLCSVWIAGSIYLMIEMDTPFTGTIHVSPAPLERALDYVRRG